MYYGDEIAMTDGVVVGAANKDPMFDAGKVKSDSGIMKGKKKSSLLTSLLISRDVNTF